MGKRTDEYLVIKAKSIFVYDSLYPLALIRFLYLFNASFNEGIDGTRNKVESDDFVVYLFDKRAEDKFYDTCVSKDLGQLSGIILGKNREAKVYLNKPVKIGINTQGYEVIATHNSLKYPDGIRESDFIFTVGKLVGKPKINNTALKISMAGADGNIREMGGKFYGIELKSLDSSIPYEFLLNCVIYGADTISLGSLVINGCYFDKVGKIYIKTLYNLARSCFSNCDVKCDYVNFGRGNKFINCLVELGEAVNFEIDSFIISQLEVKAISNLIVSHASFSVFNFYDYLEYSDMIGASMVGNVGDAFDKKDFCKIFNENCEGCQYYFYAGIDEAGMKKWLSEERQDSCNVYYFNKEDYQKYKDYRQDVDIRCI